jgi:DNA recombination protein RmuC
MVVLFLAGDHFLNAALEREPDLLERALAKKVLIATPMTLISILKGVGYGWRQEKLAQNAEELRRIGAEFYDRLRGFSEVYVEAGRHLAKALEAYNRTAGSWDARVLPSLRRMSELGVGGANEPPAIPKVDGAVREPQRIPTQIQLPEV